MVRLEHAGESGGSKYRGLLHYRGRVIPVFRAEETANDCIEREDLFLIVTSVANREIAIVAEELDTIFSTEDSSCSRSETGGAAPIEVVAIDGSLQKVINPSHLVA